MTRENFKDIISKIVYPDVNDIIKQLEALGLLKFEEEKEVFRLCSYERSGRFSIHEWPIPASTVSRYTRYNNFLS